jgi:hypothetical protein
MNSQLISIVVLFSILSSIGPATAGVEPWCESTAEIAYSGEGVPILLSWPDGGGESLTEARLAHDMVVDATITLHLLDAGLDPLVGVPGEDLWLRSNDESWVICPGGTIADAPTDQFGATTWTAPLLAGGSSQTPTLVVVDGNDMTCHSGLELRHISPDLNADLVVDLKDAGIFSRDFAAGYQFRSDFSRDGSMNVADVVYMATAIGARCQ